MPRGDQIFARLELATMAEREALAGILKAKDTSVETLSRELRAAAGHRVRNLFRDDHELSYAQILDDVVAEAARAADWPAPQVSEAAWNRWREEYAILALAFASKKNDKTTESESTAARQDAEAALRGQFSIESQWKQGAMNGGIVAGAAVLAGAIGLSLLAVHRFVLSPKAKVILPAVLVLIQIRVREAAELSLRSVVDVR